MNAYEAYKKYVAVKLHFQGNYDYFKFSGGVKVSKDKFDTRRDKVFFERAAKIYTDQQFEQLLVSNFVQDKDVWVGDLLSEKGRAIYVAWKKKHQSLEYTFSEDMSKIQSLIELGDLGSFDDLFRTVDGDAFPTIIMLLFHKEIQLESFIIMNSILNFMSKFDKTVQDAIVYPELKRVVMKYTPFLHIDTKKFKKIMQQTFLQKSLVQNL